MGEDGENSSPQYSGSFLFLVGLAIDFKKCSEARRDNNIQAMFRALDAASVALSGYYDKENRANNDRIELEIEAQLDKLRAAIDLAIKKYEDTRVLNVGQDIYTMLYRLERQLTKTWKDSGLQMSMKAREDLDNAEFA